VQDFVINRNPEFALTVVYRYNPEEQRKALENVRQYIKDTTDYFKTLNQIKFNNYNHYFKSYKDYLKFCAREKKFKPGTGYFDFIYDLEEKKDQTMMARFNYLEKLPLRKIEVSKYSMGISVKNREEKIMIVEVVDANGKLNREEIEKRSFLKSDEDKNKYIKAYYVSPD
jgi:hypothetical protein